MFGMSSALELIVYHWVIAVFVICAATVLVVSLVRWPVSPEKAANWPMAEGTIRSLGKVVYKSYSADIGVFSYKVNDEYYSGRLTVSRSFSTGNRALTNLIDQKFQVRYNPRKPEKFSVPQQELDGFLLDPYFGPATSDIGSDDLNLNKI